MKSAGKALFLCHLLASCLLLAGKETSPVRTADAHYYAQQHQHYHQHTQNDGNNVQVIWKKEEKKSMRVFKGDKIRICT